MAGQTEVRTVRDRQGKIPAAHPPGRKLMGIDAGAEWQDAGAGAVLRAGAGGVMIRKTFAWPILVALVVLSSRDGLAAQQRTSARPAKATSAGSVPAAPRKARVLDPRALEVLQAIGRRLAVPRTLTFTAVTTYESPSLLGPALAYTTSSQVTV